MGGMDAGYRSKKRFGWIKPHVDGYCNDFTTIITATSIVNNQTSCEEKNLKQSLTETERVLWMLYQDMITMPVSVSMSVIEQLAFVPICTNTLQEEFPNQYAEVSNTSGFVHKTVNRLYTKL